MGDFFWAYPSVGIGTQSRNFVITSHSLFQVGLSAVSFFSTPKPLQKKDVAPIPYADRNPPEKSPLKFKIFAIFEIINKVLRIVILKSFKQRLRRFAIKKRPLKNNNIYL